MSVTASASSPTSGGGGMNVANAAETSPHSPQDEKDSADSFGFVGEKLKGEDFRAAKQLANLEERNLMGNENETSVHTGVIDEKKSAALLDDMKKKEREELEKNEVNAEKLKIRLKGEDISFVMDELYIDRDLAEKILMQNLGNLEASLKYKLLKWPFFYSHFPY